MKMRPFIALFAMCALLSPCSARAEDATPTNRYVIVHGAWGGGWAFKEVDQLLSARGHEVHRPTLTGLGERGHLLSPSVDLTTHINDIVNFLIWEDLRDVVLVGHSYGGMVITGVADRVPERIRRLIYLDAMVPKDGECWAELMPDLPAGVVLKNGSLVPPWVRPAAPPPSDLPHPAQTRLERIHLTNTARAAVSTAYILTAEDETDPAADAFYPSYLRALDYRWDTVIMRGDHNVHWSKPKELVDLLISLARPQTATAAGSPVKQ